MKEIGKIPSGGNYDRDDAKTNYETKNINLDDINIVFTTKKDEKDRTTFENTFSLVDLSQSDSGKKFLDSLKNNKSLLMEKLDLTDEQYDTLACVAMGLASQETGMGEEQGYINENSDIKLITNVTKSEESFNDITRKVFNEDKYASNVYQTVLSQKTGLKPVNDLSRPAVIL